MSNWLSFLLTLSGSIYVADGWFFGMLGCQNKCSTYTGYYQSRSPQPLPPPHQPLLNSYATPPAMYIPPAASYPVAPQMAFPMSSYAMPQYAVIPQHSYILPPPYPTPPPYVRPPPVYVTQPPVYVTPKYVTPPPPKCFQNNDGFKCCNKQLDKFLDEKVVEMLKPEWQRCNMQRLATQLQNQAQAMFNHSMESIVASGNMENLSHYRGDLYCKKKSQDGKIVLIYGTSIPYSLNAGETRPMNESELKMHNYPEDYGNLNAHNGNERHIQS